MFRRRLKFGTGALIDRKDHRDRVYDGIAFGATPFDWEKGFDIEKEIGSKIIIKNQDGSSSCVGQGWAYYEEVLNTKETGIYNSVSAKAIYSQIFLPGGGAYIRDGGNLAVDWGGVEEMIVSSYNNNNPPDEAFMRDRSWKNQEVDNLAVTLKAKEYRTIQAYDNIDLFAIAIRDNFGVVGGITGDNNNSWYTNEPKIPKSLIWQHCLYFGKAGIDVEGKYIASPNSWGVRQTDPLHEDGWQKFREEWFNINYMFNPWTLTDLPNPMDEETKNLIIRNEKKFIIESEAPGRKGVIVDGKLREVVREGKRDAVSEACIYVMATNGFGEFVNKVTFDKIPKDNNF